MKSSATTVEEFLASLPPDRLRTIEAVRKVIRKNLDKEFKEGILYGGLGYFLPHSKYPYGYHCDPKVPLPFASVLSQKNHIGLYLFYVYMNPVEEKLFRKEWLASGKKLDMGKSCVRVKSLEDIPLDVLGRSFKRARAKPFVEMYESKLPESVKRKRAKNAAPAVKAAKKAGKKTAKVAKKAAKKATRKKTGKAATSRRRKA